MTSNPKVAITASTSFRFLNWFSQYLYLPSLPLLITYFHTTRISLQSSLLYFLIGSLFSQLLGSHFILILGKKKTLVLKMITAIMGTIIILFSHSIVEFNIGRFLQGFGIGLAYSMGNVIIHDAHRHIGKDNVQTAVILSHIGIYSAWFPGLAMVLGAHLYVWLGWHANFIVLLILYVSILLFISLFFGKEKGHFDKFTMGQYLKEFQSYWICLQNKGFRRYVFSLVLISGSVTAYYLASTFIYHSHYQLSPIEIGYLTIFPMSGHCVGKGLSTHLSKKYKRVSCMIGGLSLTIIASLLMTIGLLITGSYWFMLSTIFLYAIGAGTIEPQTSAEVMHLFAHKPISAQALVSSLITLSAVLLGFISILFHPSYPLGLSFLLLGLSIFALFLFVSQRQAVQE